MCTDATQTVHSEGFKGFTMEGEWEEDSNCQDITRHQSLFTASMGFYSLSESPSMANAGWSQSELLILGKILTRPITQMDSCFQQENRGQAHWAVFPVSVSLTSTALLKTFRATHIW